MISIKSPNVLESLLLVRYHPKLVEIVAWIARRYMITITDGYRVGDSGVHGTNPCRGMDIRSYAIFNHSGAIMDPVEFVTEVNRCWQYDENRPEKVVALYHDAGSGYHIHLQVCDATRQRAPG